MRQDADLSHNVCHCSGENAHDHFVNFTEVSLASKGKSQSPDLNERDD